MWCNSRLVVSRSSHCSLPLIWTLFGGQVPGTIGMLSTPRKVKTDVRASLAAGLEVGVGHTCCRRASNHSQTVGVAADGGEPASTPCVRKFLTAMPVVPVSLAWMAWRTGVCVLVAEEGQHDALPDARFWFGAMRRRLGVMNIDRAWSNSFV